MALFSKIPAGCCESNNMWEQYNYILKGILTLEASNVNNLNLIKKKSDRHLERFMRHYRSLESYINVDLSCE